VGLIAVAATAVVMVIAFRLVAVWLGLGLVFAQWSVRGIPPVPGIGVPRPAARVGAVIAWSMGVLHACTSVEQPGYGRYALSVALAFVVLFIGAAFPDQVETAARFVGTKIAAVVGAISFFVLALLALPVPWLAGRLSGAPMDSSNARNGTWARREVDALHPLRGFAQIRYPGRRSLRRMLMVVPATLLTAGLGMGSLALYDVVTGYQWKPTAGGFRLDPGSAAARIPHGSDDGIPLAEADAAWYPKYREDIDWMINNKTAYSPLAPIRIRDVRSKYVNISNGARKTWTPAPCSCTRLLVWMYGGSTAFGLDQRDEHTIASYLARLAERDGIVLDVVNKGVIGDMHWQEAQRFQWDVTTAEPPDLVIFYDGVNEVWGTTGLENKRLGDSPQPYAPLTQEISDGIVRTSENTAGPVPDGVSLVEPEKSSTGNAKGLGALVATRYDRSRKMSGDVARANGIEIAWFWQPTRVSRPYVAGEVAGTAADDEYSITLYETASHQVAESGEVVDLSNVLDSNRDPLFTDDVHHNEQAAELIAAGMYQSLRPELRRLTEAKGGGS
jgi:lysophospholipase L1-like esterase